MATDTQTPTETPIGDWLVLVSENYSPIDFMLIGDNLDRFMWGALVTLELTFLSLLLGGILCRVLFCHLFVSIGIIN